MCFVNRSLWMTFTTHPYLHSLQLLRPIPVAKQSKARAYGRSLAGIAGSNSTRAWMSISCGCCVLWGRNLCDVPISHTEESYRLWCVIVCDLEISIVRRPWTALDCCARNKKHLSRHKSPGISTSHWMKERLASIAKCIVTGGRCIDNSELDHKQIFPDDYKDYITWAADYYRTQAGWEITLTCDVFKD